jgi:hypothetical protein
MKHIPADKLAALAKEWELGDVVAKNDYKEGANDQRQIDARILREIVASAPESGDRIKALEKVRDILADLFTEAMNIKDRESLSFTAYAQRVLDAIPPEEPCGDGLRPDALHQIEMGMEDWKAHGCHNRHWFAGLILNTLSAPRGNGGTL